MAQVLDAGLIEGALNNLPEWSGSPERLTRTAELTDDQHREMHERIMVTAESMNHHPDIDRSGGQTHFVLSTHSAGGVTAMDIALASEISTVIRRVKGQPPLPAQDEVLSSHAEPGHASEQDPDRDPV